LVQRSLGSALLIESVGGPVAFETQSEIHRVLRRYADAWASNDFATIVDCYHDDIVFYYFGTSPLAGVHRGKAVCLSILKRVREKTQRKLLEIQDVMAGERFGVVLACERFERDGRTVEVNRVLKYKVRDGKLSECWIYDEDQRLIDEFLG
jgi:uncharacterized protein